VLSSTQHFDELDWWFLPISARRAQLDQVHDRELDYFPTLNRISREWNESSKSRTAPETANGSDREVTSKNFGRPTVINPFTTYTTYKPSMCKIPPGCQNNLPMANLIWKLHKLLQILIPPLRIWFRLNHEPNLWSDSELLPETFPASSSSPLGSFKQSTRHQTKSTQTSKQVTQTRCTYCFVKCMNLMSLQIQNSCWQALQELTYKRLGLSHLNMQH